MANHRVCAPSQVTLPVEFEAPPDGAVGVEYENNGGRIVSVTFANAANMTSRVRTGLVASVIFSASNEVLDVVPLDPGPQAVGCVTEIVTTPETTTIKCRVNGCASEKCMIYSVVPVNGPTQRFCGCNQNPTPTPTPVTPSPAPAPPTPSPAPTPTPT